MRVTIVLVVLLLQSVTAQAEKRVALLIGNQSYGAEIGRLTNPHNDIALLESALKGLGFEVATVRDAGLAALHQAVNQHIRRVRAAGATVSFFYYSGHGAQDGATGVNYLIPVDVKSAEDTELWDQSLQLTEITRKLKRDAGDATHFVVFDACRNALKLRKAGTRSLVQSKGFVPVAQEHGMLIAYATAEGELASDLGAGAGPYAKVLAEEIIRPGIEAVAMFRIVQRRVRAAIKQEPYLGFSALGDIFLAGPDTRPVAVPSPPTPTTARLSEAAEVWDRTKTTDSIAILEAFASRYKETFYANLAAERMATLKQKPEHKTRPPARLAPASPIVVLVDDVPITAEDIDQRRQLMAIGTSNLREAAAKPSRSAVLLRKEAQEELIEEQLKLREAKKIGFATSEDEINQVLKIIYERNKMTEEQFTEKLKARGVGMATLRERVRAQLAWREVTRRKFSAQISIAESDVDRILSASAGEDAVELQVQKITLPLPAKMDQANLAKRYAEAADLRRQFTDCKTMASLAKDAGNAKFEGLEFIKPSSIPEPTRSMLLSAKDGDVLPPTTSAAGFEVYALCGRRLLEVDEKQRAAAREELAQKELESRAKSYLRELRQDAHIVFR